MKTKPIIIISGSIKSVFLEIFFKSLKKKYQSPLILICCKNYLYNYMKKNNLKNQIKILDIQKIKNKKISNNKINLIDVPLEKSNNEDLNKKLINQYIKKSFDVAFELINKKITHKLINGPINKKEFLNKKFLGITEYISSHFKEKKVGMLIYNEKLSVCPLTTHVPLKLVSKNIKKKEIKEKIVLINLFYKKVLKIKPKIAVTGLNPHCESILKFNEDEKIVSESIKMAKKKGINVTGPYPADTIFLKANRKKFDVILGMYHDQVLTPIKALFEYDAFNITMGLPFLRVSPDHGPNEKMINKNKSNPLSLIKAIKFLDSK
tara:strand:- start:1517 stop:2479 length:963 start_codon:yes stop_codon:yes gene_type:complete